MSSVALKITIAAWVSLSFMCCKPQKKWSLTTKSIAEQRDEILKSSSESNEKEQVYIWLEAESGINPMRNSLEIIYDEDLSGAQYISEPDGKVVIPFVVTKSDTYFLHGRFFAQDYNNDSFTLSFFDNDKTEVFGGVWNNINDQNQNNWSWDICSIGVENGQEIIQVYLKNGPYTLEIYPRDANEIKIDKFLLTSNDNWTQDDGISTGDILVEAEVGIATAPFAMFNDLEDSTIVYTAMNAANADYKFHIPHDGNYYLLGYIYGKDPSSDSMFLIMDDQELDIWHFCLDKNWSQWKWSCYNENSPISFEKGEHQIRLVQRETNAALDAMLITDDANLFLHLIGRDSID